MLKRKQTNTNEHQIEANMRRETISVAYHAGTWSELRAKTTNGTFIKLTKNLIMSTDDSDKKGNIV